MPLKELRSEQGPPIPGPVFPPMEIELRAVRNNLSQSEISYIKELSKERRGPSKYTYAAPTSKFLFRCPLPTHGAGSAPCNVPINPHPLQRKLETHIR